MISTPATLAPQGLVDKTKGYSGWGAQTVCQVKRFGQPFCQGDAPEPTKDLFFLETVKIQKQPKQKQPNAPPTPQTKMDRA